MHELAVIAGLIARSGRGVAERYVLHKGIQEAKDYQNFAERLGYEPIDDNEMQAHRKLRAELIKRFGRPSKKPYGWAVPLYEGNSDPKFRDLEQLAGLDHLRPHYGWASHRLHAGSKGAALSTVSRGPQSIYLHGTHERGPGRPWARHPRLSPVAPADDVLDAAAAALTAGRIAEEKARSLPDPPEKHPGGRAVAIWY